MVVRVCVLACLTVLAAGSGEPGVRAHFIGGTVASIPANSGARLDLTGGEALLFRVGSSDLRIPYARINTIEYGQKVNRRYAEAVLISPMLLLAKSRKHFVTIGYVDERGAQQALVMQVEKGDIRMVLASLEARSGRRVEYQDDEARKAGKG